MPAPALPDRIRSRADLEAFLALATNYEERLPPRPVSEVFKLARVERLLAFLGDPQRGPVTAHVAGSKGKGSVVRMIDAVLRETARGPVGCYTSPHLQDLAERVAVDGVPASYDELAQAAERTIPFVRQTLGTEEAPTFFELFTAAAWLVFRARGCTSVVLETGLGGRLDATNVCRPAVTVITLIEREHTSILGNTLEQIAREKAGILKAGVPAVTGATGVALAEIEARAQAVGAPLEVLGRDVRVLAAETDAGPRTRARIALPAGGEPLDVALPLAGVHQATNAALAAAALEHLGASRAAIGAGLARVVLPGTLEPLGGDPLLVVDGGHTGASARAATEAATRCWPDRRRVLLVAVLEEKDLAAILAGLRPGADVLVATTLPTPRARGAADVAHQARQAGFPVVEPVEDPDAALRRAEALAGPGGLVLAIGSVRLAGRIRATARAPGPGSRGS
jgi:dihydrofolate synthase/folylpolyglutamate synthase